MTDFHLGFTGTRHGMTKVQLDAVEGLISRLCETRTVVGHHGDCVGADAEFHALCLGLGVTVVIHPGPDGDLRANCQGAVEVLLSMPHLARNRMIVLHTEALIAAPRELTPQVRGGTWYTHDFALKHKRPVAQVRPDAFVIYSSAEWPR